MKVPLKRSACLSDRGAVVYCNCFRTSMNLFFPSVSGSCIKVSTAICSIGAPTTWGFRGVQHFFSQAIFAPHTWQPATHLCTAEAGPSQKYQDWGAARAPVHHNELQWCDYDGRQRQFVGDYQEKHSRSQCGPHVTFPPMANYTISEEKLVPLSPHHLHLCLASIQWWLSELPTNRLKSMLVPMWL